MALNHAIAKSEVLLRRKETNDDLTDYMYRDSY